MSKQYWFKKIQVSRAIVDGIECYYLIDDEMNFIPYAKNFIDLQIARAGENTSPILCALIVMVCDTSSFFLLLTTKQLLTLTVILIS